MTEPTDLEREVARAIAETIFGEEDADEFADCEDATDASLSIPDLARAAIAACLRWRPIETYRAGDICTDGKTRWFGEPFDNDEMRDLAIWGGWEPNRATHCFSLPPPPEPEDGK